MDGLSPIVNGKCTACGSTRNLDYSKELTFTGTDVKKNVPCGRAGCSGSMAYYYKGTKAGWPAFENSPAAAAKDHQMALEPHQEAREAREARAAAAAAAQTAAQYDVSVVSTTRARQPTGGARPAQHSAWVERYSDQHQRKFWTNRSTGESTWNDPTTTTQNPAHAEGGGEVAALAAARAVEGALETDAAADRFNVDLDPRPLLECGKAGCGATKRATIQDGAAFLKDTKHHVSCPDCGGVMWVHGKRPAPGTSRPPETAAVVVDVAKVAAGGVADAAKVAAGGIVATVGVVAAAPYLGAAATVAAVGNSMANTVAAASAVNPSYVRRLEAESDAYLAAEAVRAKSARKQEMKPLLEKAEEAISALNSADGDDLAVDITVEFLAIQLVRLLDPNQLKPEMIAGESGLADEVKLKGLALVVGGTVVSAIKDHQKELYAAEHGVEMA